MDDLRGPVDFHGRLRRSTRENFCTLCKRLWYPRNQDNSQWLRYSGLSRQMDTPYKIGEFAVGAVAAYTRELVACAFRAPNLCMHDEERIFSPLDKDKETSDRFESSQDNRFRWMIHCMR